MLSPVTVSPIITAFHSCCVSHHDKKKLILKIVTVGLEETNANVKNSQRSKIIMHVVRTKGVQNQQRRSRNSETESLLIAVLNNAIRTNYIKAKIDKTQQNSKCRLLVRETKRSII